MAGCETEINHIIPRLPTTSLMPGSSTLALSAMSVLGVGTGRVLPTLGPAHTTWASLAPMSARPTATPVSSASPYAASLLPK